jgi:uncharacterized protein YhaN
VSGLRITRVVLTDVGVLRGRVDLGAFDPGLTLITGGNETGKTTTVDALRCAFFEKHGTRKAAVRGLQPHGESVGPEIEVDFLLDGHTYQLRKRFLSRPMAELREDGGTPLTGTAADERVWDLLGAGTPGSGEVKQENMGLWGVLWVSQDDAAFTDPAARLGEDTRGALQDAIGRQVGQIAGGRHGELLRARVHEEAGRYWTLHGKPSGELRAAQEGWSEAEDRARTIERAIHEVEDQALRHASLAARLEELARERPNLEAELEQTERAVATVAQLRRDRDEADQKLAASRAQLETARVRLREREELVQLTEQLSGRVEAGRATLVEMECTLAARQDTEARVGEGLKERAGEAEEARAAFQGFDEALGRARLAQRAGELARALERARALREEIESLTTQRAGAPDDASYERLRELEREHRNLAAALEGEGTRFVAGDVRVAIGRARTLAVEGLGEVGLVPGRPGLSVARDRLRDATGALASALQGCGQSSLEEASVLRSARVELEAEHAAVSDQMDQRAPDGLPALSEALAAAEARLQRDQEVLALAEAASESLAGLRATLDDAKMDDASLARLDDLARELEVARARQDAIGTGVRIHALRRTELTVDDGAVERLDAGERRSLSLARPTQITVGDLAELEVVPGGEDVVAAAARRVAADDALGRALSELGVEDLTQARELGRSWMETRASVTAAEESLAERAPDGLEALREDVRERRREHRSLDETVAGLAGLQQRLGALEVELAANPVTAEVQEHLSTLTREQAEARDAAHAVAARLRIGDGEEQLVLERTSGDVGGLAWEIVPGEGGAELEAAMDQLAVDLAAALGRHGLEDMTGATRSWRVALDLGREISGLAGQLSEIAPDGLGALEAAVDAAGPVESEAVDLEALGSAAEEARAAADAAVDALETAREEAASAERERRDFEAEVRDKRVQIQTLDEELADLNARLASARAEATDDALTSASHDASAAAGEAQDVAEAAEAAVRRAGPDLLENDPDRAHASVEENRRKQGELRAEMSGVKALLDRAAAEGHFEELGEAQADLEFAQRRVARLERTADAVLRLAQEVDRAYDAAQARFLAPVVKEAGPYLDAVRPGTEIRMTPDLALDGVVRRGTEEEFDDLSGGTREQLSVIVRIALAKVLARDAETDPLPLVLDDTMGWTDDARFLQMTRILRNAAKEFQIIVLTCHPERFARLQPGRTIDLEKARRDAVEA